MLMKHMISLRSDSQLYDKHFPFTLKRQAKTVKSWMNDSLLQSIRYKNRLYKQFLHKPSHENETK